MILHDRTGRLETAVAGQNLAIRLHDRTGRLENELRHGVFV